MNDTVLYKEKISSTRTLFLFLALTVIFMGLFTWRTAAGDGGFLIWVFLFFAIVFLFYTVNYRVLEISLTSEHLQLSFGIFRWAIPLSNIDTCQLDEGLPGIVAYGGAGIHFMTYRGRYRASFNFLEHGRVVIGLKRKAGLVRDVSISTGRPDELIARIEQAVSAAQTTQPGLIEAVS